MVRCLPREGKIPGSNPACAGIFSGSSHTSDLKIGTPVATLPGAWRYRVSIGTGQPGVSILWLGEVERLICNFYLSVAAHKIVWADPSLRYTSLLLGRSAAKKQTNIESNRSVFWFPPQLWAFFRVEQYQWLKIWHYRVSAGTGCPSVNTLWLGKLDLQLLSQYGSTYTFPTRSVLEIH